MTVEEIKEFTKARKKSIANNNILNSQSPIVEYDEENDPSSHIIDSLPNNHPSKTPVDRDLEDVMTVASEPEKSKAILDNQRVIQSINDNKRLKPVINDNKTSDNIGGIASDEVDDSLLDDIIGGIKNVGRGAGKNLARYNKLLNEGISKLLDVSNPYTYITGNKTDLSQYFSDNAKASEYYLNKWNNDSKDSKLATAGEILLDPAILLPSGVAQTGGKLARMAQSGLAGAAQGAGLQYAKDYADGNNPYENVAIAGGISGAVNTAIAGLTRGKVNNINGIADNYINEPYSLKKELNEIADEAISLYDKAKNKTASAYKNNIRPLTKAGRQKNLNDEFRDYVLSGRINKSLDEINDDSINKLINRELEEIADDYINENIRTLSKSNYNILNAKNYDSVINDLNKPNYKVLNNENIDDILMADEELMTNISNIRRKNKLNSKNKSIDEVISEYPYKDTSYLEKELNKSLKNMSKSDIFKQANELKANKSNYSEEEYNRLLKELQNETLSTADGMKWQALNNIIKSRKNAPSPANYKSSYKSLTNAKNISNIQPKSTQSLIDNYNDIYNYDYKLPDIEDDILDNSKSISNYNDFKNLYSNTLNNQYVSNKNILNEYDNVNKNITSLIDENTGEVLEIPHEILELIKKKALMNY